MCLKRNVAKALALVLTFSAIGTCAVNDEASAKKKVKVSLNKTSLSLKVGESATLKVKKAPAKAKLTWKSTKKAVATVKKGVVKAKKAGKTTVTVKVKAKGVNKTLKCNVKVKAATNINNNATPLEAPSTQVPSTAPAKATDAPTAEPTVEPTAEPTAAPTAEPTPNDDPLPKAEKGELLSPKLRMNVYTAIDPSKHITPSEGKFEDYDMTLSEQNAATISNGNIVGMRPGQCDIILTSKADPSKVEKFRLSIMGACEPEDKYFFKEKDVPHGTVSEFTYPSQYRTDGVAHAYMYLPPNYNPAKKYNLFFCLHGGGQDYNYWITDQCNAQFIMDNLLAEGQAEESIVVFTDGDMPYNKNKDYPNVVPNPYLGAPGTMDWNSCFLLEFEILYDLIPYMKDNYSIYGTPDHLGVCGLSMGCAQTYEIGFKHPDVFHYMGGFSAGTYESPNDYLVTDATIPASELNKTMKLVLFIQGQQDTMADNSERIFVGKCDKNGLNSFFHEVQDAGHDHKCWRKGFYAFAKYAFK